jgi:hypothetical protein
VSSLVVMGSGETAPTLVPVHREIFARTREVTGRDVVGAFIDTPFGFQLNADELTERTLGYFADSVGQPVRTARWRRADEPLVDRERAMALLQQADWAFSGPGSPTYALREWASTEVPQALADVPRRGGTLVLGSAAAVTLGSHTIPVYEIYKAGQRPHWLPGLDLLGTLTGLRAAVVPHYDNAEGGSHDTRFCYLGEPRLARLEDELPDDVGVLGVDEHTALWFDLAAGSARVLGRGRVTVRRRGASTTFGAGEVLPVERLDTLLRGGSASGAAAGPEPASDQPAGSLSEVAAGPEPAPDQPAGSLSEVAAGAQRSFETALAGRDVSGCVTAILLLEQAIRDWSADMLLSDDGPAARRTLRSLVVRLGEVAEVGARDPQTAVAPYVEALLEVRAIARAAKDYPTSDLVRDRLVAAGVEVQDTPDGASWSLG